MKIDTLVKIAKLIEKELGIRHPGTVEEVWTQLKEAAGHCRTKQAAAEAIAKEVYGLEPPPDVPIEYRPWCDWSRATNQQWP